MMNKLSIVFGIVLIGAFIFLAFKSVGNQIVETQSVLKTQTNKNQNEGLLIPPPPTFDSLEDLTNTQEEKNTSNDENDFKSLTHFCTDEIETVRQTDWYQQFYKLYQTKASSQSEIQEICVHDSFKKILFLAQDQQTGSEQIGWYSYNNDKETIEQPTVLQFLKTNTPNNIGPQPYTTNHYALTGWLNSETFIYAATTLVETKQYFLFDITKQSNKMISTCSLKTQTLQCGAAEHEAWGCPLGQTTTHTTETCSATE